LVGFQTISLLLFLLLPVLASLKQSGKKQALHPLPQEDQASQHQSFSFPRFHMKERHSPEKHFLAHQKNSSSIPEVAFWSL